MGILSDTITVIREDLKKEQISFSDDLNQDIEHYISNKLTDKVKGKQIIQNIISEMIEHGKVQIDLLKTGDRTMYRVSQEIEDLKILLRPERKPFQKDMRKYGNQFWLFFALTILTVLVLVYLLVLPVIHKGLIEHKLATQLIYRISILIPFSTIIALLIYQYQNALKHYHKACESIHVMGSYPAIINTICMNQKEKERANSRLFDILFGWNPRPSGWSSKDKKTPDIEQVLKHMVNNNKKKKTKGK
ncbi:hypothetical protein [uncultured Psychroserpens sp.]|uniref:hypothetical protein n=1 Tax=uncultured Psychroserpens sp. TaxID=255436 RepID=UPI002621AC85|nr:hypothetical protein [uncultured Psychroserpens sp.]